MDKITIASPLPMVTADTCCGAPSRATHLAEQLKSLAAATRLRMLDLLTQQTETLCVCDITKQFDQHQPSISHHLRILRAAGLVDCEKRGVWAYYWATAQGKRHLSIAETLMRGSPFYYGYSSVIVDEMRG